MDSRSFRTDTKTIFRLTAERDSLSIVADEHGCPTAARGIAKACLEIAPRRAAQPERAPYRVYHFAGEGEATGFEFARAIVDLPADRLGRSPQVVPMKTSDIQRPLPAPPIQGSIARRSFAHSASNRGHGIRRSKIRSIGCGRKMDIP